MESLVSLVGKEGHTNIQISAELGSNRGPFGRKAEILPTAPSRPDLLILSELHAVTISVAKVSGKRGNQHSLLGRTPMIWKPFSWPFEINLVTKTCSPCLHTEGERLG